VAAPPARPAAPPARETRPARPAAATAFEAPLAEPGNRKDRPRDVERYEDVRIDAVVDDPRALASSYGRDPHRPTWVDGGASAPTANGADRTERRRPLHRVDCAECGRPAEVPFRPDQSRPVYCADCFRGRGRSTRAEMGAARA
jgi:CxxC-x17-CxxC domain-containing protein